MLENFLREYNLNRIFLSNIGLWPFQNKYVKTLLYTFCFLLEMSYCPFEVLLLYDHWDDTQMIFEGGYQIIMLASFFVRLINEFWNRNKVIQLYQAIDDHWNIFTNDIEVQVLKDYSMLSRKFTKYYSLLMYSLMSGFIVIPLTPVFLDIILPLTINDTRPRFLAFEVEFRINKDEYFFLCFVYTTAITIVGISIMVSVDAMQITCTAHACSLFMAVSQRIESIIMEVDSNEELGSYKYRKLTSTEFELKEEIMYQEYIDCLKKHQLAIEFVNMIESSYQGLSLCLLLLGIATLSCIGIRIIYVLDQLGETIRFTFIIVGALLTVLIPCYSGQRLIDESQNVFYRAYAADWYNFSPRLKSLLMITLYRSNISCNLKAGNMIPLSISTYAAVIRMGMSYFTAFLSLKE